VATNERPFWEVTPLAAMSRAQWEALCDGCGLCCLHKVEDDATGEVFYTDVACRHLDRHACRCTCYPERTTEDAGCVALTPEGAARWTWLPETCAYRRVAEGRPLEWWHPLVSGDPETVHRAGISLRGRAVVEEKVADEALSDHIVDWPV
jgi:uncharacterized cysteine cluster protein YcgN (CxxCxxCC family)